MPVSEATYKQLSLEDDENKWELVCGQLRRKPAVTFAHTHTRFLLSNQLVAQLDLDAWFVHVEGPRLKLPDGQYFMPDLAVIPAALVTPHLDSQDSLEEYVEPLPLVVEVWSKSTGGYDVTTKLPGYRQRADKEIWLIHPYERWLRRWVREGNGYREEQLRGGAVGITGLPGAVIDLDDLFRKRA